MDRVLPTLKRLGLIYIVWSLVFLILDAFNHDLPSLSDLPTRLILGVRMHLWYIPALMLSLLAYALLSRTPWPGLFSFMLYAIGLAGGTYTPLTHVDLSIWSRNGCFFGTIFVYVGVSTARKLHPPRLGNALALIVAGYALHAVELTWLQHQYGLDWIHERVNYFVGTLSVGTGIGWFALARPNFGSNTPLPRLGLATLGIYLIHLDVMGWLAVFVFWNGIFGQLMLVVATYVITLGLVELFAAWKPLRKMLH